MNNKIFHFLCRTSHLSGKVLINGKERNLRRFRKLSCYIMQDDRLLPYITVREAMMISANLKLGKNMTMAAKNIVIDEIIDALGLNECSKTMSANLSGGQRKRLSIALELVNNPPVMFFDEPTSGLDSSTCFQLINLLKSLASGGRTIVCTIHQPSARLFEMFDHLYLLAEGQCIYKGRVQALVPFLSSLGYECPGYHNPADYVMEVACGEYGEAVTRLVTAINNGKCDNYQSASSSDKLTESLLAITNGISTITDVYSKPSSQTLVTKPPNTSSCTEDENLVVAKINNKKDFTVINLPIKQGDDESSLQNKSNLKENSKDGCTSSLLDSSESVIEIPMGKTGFPTSGFTQFWILLKRTFLTIMRDQTLTHMRLLSHIIVGAIIGMIFYDIGENASKVTSNAGCIFFTTLFTMFTAMMPTILTCKFIKHKKLFLNFYYTYLILFIPYYIP